MKVPLLFHSDFSDFTDPHAQSMSNILSTLSASLNRRDVMSSISRADQFHRVQEVGLNSLRFSFLCRTRGLVFDSLQTVWLLL
ncbi:hypothetical protein QQF64_019912 [Cirrhinus molitorella]|uniref:Uncharacterized protein n=1 Tax=Cirrhinus molitorella TaxID=172907 RepID=A0ABR3LJA9_9TELE